MVCKLCLNKAVEKLRKRIHWDVHRHPANKDIRGDTHIQKFSFSSFWVFFTCLCLFGFLKCHWHVICCLLVDGLLLSSLAKSLAPCPGGSCGRYDWNYSLQRENWTYFAGKGDFTENIPFMGTWKLEKQVNSGLDADIVPESLTNSL